MQSDIRFLSGELSGAKLTIVAGISPLMIENKISTLLRVTYIKHLELNKLYFNKPYI